jgi:hypothetical protein
MSPRSEDIKRFAIAHEDRALVFPNDELRPEPKLT